MLEPTNQLAVWGLPKFVPNNKPIIIFGLLDFGLPSFRVKDPHSNTEHGVTPVTNIYMSPEVGEQLYSTCVTAASDIYRYIESHI